ncbi:hypothetical protein HYE68_004157 [Fusarium pseudograminearum]|nr:hypothetical protein HYE68_004157 [Fusarium pseudograminearum]
MSASSVDTLSVAEAIAVEFQSCIPLEASGTVFDKTEKRRDYEKAKKNFNQQWKRLKDKLHARADSATEKSLGEAAFDEHSENKLLGRHPDQLLPGESSQSQSQANQVDEDDGNPDWETDDELNEDEEEEPEDKGNFRITTKYARKTLKEALESLWTKCHYLRNHAKWSADEIAMFRDI